MARSTAAARTPPPRPHGLVRSRPSALILVLLGGGLFVVIRSQFARSSTTRSHDATLELDRAARIREMEVARRRAGRSSTPSRSCTSPTGTLYLFDGCRPARHAGRRAGMDARARPATRSRGGDVSLNATASAAAHTLRLHAERFTLGQRDAYVARGGRRQSGARGSLRVAHRDVRRRGAGGVAARASGGWVVPRAQVDRAGGADDRAHAPLHGRRRARAADADRRAAEPRRGRAAAGTRSGDDYEDALRGIEREAERLGRIVEDLLTLARADAGERPVAQERVFLDDVTLDAADAARVVAQRRRVGSRSTSSRKRRSTAIATLAAPARDDPARQRGQVHRRAADASASTSSATDEVHDAGRRRTRASGFRRAASARLRALLSRRSERGRERDLARERWDCRSRSWIADGARRDGLARLDAGHRNDCDTSLSTRALTVIALTATAR